MHQTLQYEQQQKLPGVLLSDHILTGWFYFVFTTIPSIYSPYCLVWWSWMWCIRRCWQFGGHILNYRMLPFTEWVSDGIFEVTGFVTGIVISETISVSACGYPTVMSLRLSLFTVWVFYFSVLTIITHSYNNQTTRVDLKQEAAMKYYPAVEG